MTDHDDKVTRRYRELAREEPPAALDAAILAASRRAVARPSAASRWGPPLSIAAVLMLAVGVTLNMQREQPGVEYSYSDLARQNGPSAGAVREPAAPVPQMAPKEQMTPDSSLLRSDAKPALRAKTATPRAGNRQEDNFVQSPPPPPAKIAAEPAPPPVEQKLKKDNALADLAAPRPEPRAFSAPPAESPAPPPPAAERTRPYASSAPPASASAAPAPANAPPVVASAPAGAPLAKSRDAAEARTAETARAMPAAPGRDKREVDSTGIKGTSAQALIIDPMPELERIARLRADGRHAEADKALEEFRRRHPAFRIPDAMWERVKSKGEGEQPPFPPR